MHKTFNSFLFSEDFMIACGEGVFELYIRPNVAAGTFTKLPITHLIPGSGTTSIDDATYDPVGDHIYWIESTVDWFDDDNCWRTEFGPTTCPVTTNIGRCDYNGRNAVLLVQGITPGVYSFGSSKY